MLRVALVIRPREADFAGAHEARKVVDVAVGFVVEDTLAEPDDASHAEEGAQLRLDLRAAQVRVSIGVEQALFGDQGGARAIDVNGAAFVDDACQVAVATFELEHFAGDQFVLVPGGVEGRLDNRPRR